MRPLSSSPNKSNTWTMCSLPLVSGVVARLCTSVHGCVSVVHGVHVCPECRWPWRRFSASVLRSVRTFAECVGLCRRTRRASESVWRLGRVVRASGKTAPERISAGGAKASPGAESGSFSVRREKWRLFRGRPGPSGGGFGDLAKSGAPAAILINAYSGDFCHPVLSNALAQEPLVYHSGTRELFSDIFGNTSKTDGTEFDIFGHFRNFRLFRDFEQICKKLSKMQKTEFHMCAHFCKTFSQTRACSQNIFLSSQISANVQMTNVQICKCAKMCRAQNAQICSANIFPNAEITNLHKSANAQFFWVQVFLFVFMCRKHFILIYGNIILINKYILKKIN